MVEFLDPNCAPVESEEGTVPGLLPSRVRKFGYYPNIASFHSGDVLLFEPRSPTRISRAISKSQKELFADDHARWTHAAIYIGEGMIVEALPFRGVVDGHVSDYLPSHNIRVRRFDVKKEADQYRISIGAMKRRGRSYDLHKIPRIAKSLINVSDLTNGYGQRHTICSQVCFDSILEATKVPLDECPLDGPVVPAHLSNTASLQDVPVGWVKIS
ncbi:MAG: hypothetical protein KUG74_10725 [Rhodobacteraceae bacterium]|nr:hypothetical protein [Paracoccaceae bacterium]